LTVFCCAANDGLTTVDRTSAAPAGEVFHKVWCYRHPNRPKTYKSMANILAGDAFLSMRDGPKHANQLVQLDVIALAAAAEAAAAAAAAWPGAPVAGNGAAHAVFAGAESSSHSSMGGEHVRSGVHSLQGVEAAAAAAAAAAADAAAQAVSLRVAQGTLLAIDLLGFAGMISWHEANEGLGLLRQQLACTMIEAAHPGLAEAAAAGELVVAEVDEGRYFMSPYNASE
jgi:hypothetical protein